MIIVIGGIKGGSGKTTIATNFAILRARERMRVLLIDADDQETSADFSALRDEALGGSGYTCIKLTGLSVRTETQKLRESFDVIIIDTGGRDTTSQRAALSIADVLLVPFVPRSFDVWTLERVSKLVGEMRAANPVLQAYAFINRADPRGVDNEEAADILREAPELFFLNAPLGSRKAFANAAAQGLSIVELKHQDSKANEELMTLATMIFSSGQKKLAIGG